MAQITESVLRPAWTLDSHFLNDQYNMAVALVSELWTTHVAPQDPTKDYIVRALKPSDLSVANETWVETVSATGNAYQNSSIAASSVADDTCIVIYGLVDVTEHQAVSYVRLTIGAGVRAEWDLHGLLGTPVDNPIYRTGYAMTPIGAIQNAAVTIEQYVIGASPQQVKTSHIVYLGVTAELAGKNIQP